MFVCPECGGLDSHLRSCSHNEEGNHYSRNVGGEDVTRGSCETSLEDLGIPGLCDT